jgi:hypothetical protein
VLNLAEAFCGLAINIKILKKRNKKYRVQFNPNILPVQKVKFN